MKSFAQALSDASTGAIVTVSSVAGLRGAAGLFGYSAAKWALRGMSRAAARDLGPLGIRVNCVIPGATNTPMLHQHGEAGIARYAQSTVLGRVAEASEPGQAILFLLSNESSFITGAELAVDGGISA